MTGEFCIHSFPVNIVLSCVRGQPLWRNSSTSVNDELYKGYRKGNPERKINEIVAGVSQSYSEPSIYWFPSMWQLILPVSFILPYTAYDFLNTNGGIYNVSIWYNSTYKNDSGNVPMALLRVPRSVNLVRIYPTLFLNIFFCIVFAPSGIDMLKGWMESCIISNSGSSKVYEAVWKLSKYV